MITFISVTMIKKCLKWIAVLGVILFLLDVIDRSLPRPPQCPVETHNFSGQKFDIEICLGNTSDREHLSLWVYSKDGAILAWRRGTFAKESRLNYMAIEDSMIRYSDSPMDRINPPADCVLNMPPTWVDWLEARLPGGIPGVNHCGTADEAVVTQAQDQWEKRVNAELIKQGRPPMRPETAPPPAVQEHP